MATVTRIDRSVEWTGIDDSFVRCRSYGHAWDEFAPIDLDAPTYGWRLSLRCLRCGTERHDNLDFKGKLMGRRYIYPQGYSQKGITPVMFREALFIKLRKQLEAANSIGADVPPPSRRRKQLVQ